jgi:hypothetical protein
MRRQTISQLFDAVPTGRIYNRRHEIFTGPTVQALSDQIEFDRPLSPGAVIQSTRRVRLRQAENGHKRTLEPSDSGPDLLRRKGPLSGLASVLWTVSLSP